MTKRARWPLAAAVYLSAGAALTVAIAWGCVLWAPGLVLGRGVTMGKDHGGITPAQLGGAGPLAKPAWIAAQDGTRLVTEAARSGGPGWVHHEATLGRRPAASRAMFGPVIGKVAGMSLIRAGWPLPALRCQGAEEFVTGSVTDWAWGWSPPEWAKARPRTTLMIPLPKSRLPLPAQIEPLGFAANTLLYAGALCVATRGRPAVRRFIRRRRGQCTACGYPIGTSPVCSECGGALT